MATAVQILSAASLLSKRAPVGGICVSVAVGTPVDYKAGEESRRCLPLFLVCFSAFLFRITSPLPNTKGPVILIRK